MKRNITFGLIFVCVMLFAVCSNPFDSPQSFSQTGYGREKISLVEGQARTVFPTIDLASFEYRFIRDGNTVLDTPKKYGVYYILPVGQYSVVAQNQVDDFIVMGSKDFKIEENDDPLDLEVELTWQNLPANGTVTGTFNPTITYPANTTAVITLKRLQNGLLGDDLLNYTTSTAQTVRSEYKTTISLEFGSYLLAVRILLKNGDFAKVGTAHAIHIYPGMTTEYKEDFYLLAATDVDDVIDLLKGNAQQGNDPDVVELTADAIIPAGATIPVGITIRTDGNTLSIRQGATINGDLRIDNGGSLDIQGHIRVSGRIEIGENFEELYLGGNVVMEAGGTIHIGTNPFAYNGSQLLNGIGSVIIEHSTFLKPTVSMDQPGNPSVPLMLELGSNVQLRINQSGFILERKNGNGSNEAVNTAKLSAPGIQIAGTSNKSLLVQTGVILEMKGDSNALAGIDLFSGKLEVNGKIIIGEYGRIVVHQDLSAWSNPWPSFGGEVEINNSSGEIVVESGGEFIDDVVVYSDGNFRFPAYGGKITIKKGGLAIIGAGRTFDPPDLETIIFGSQADALLLLVSSDAEFEIDDTEGYTLTGVAAFKGTGALILNHPLVGVDGAEFDTDKTLAIPGIPGNPLTLEPGYYEWGSNHWQKIP